jgi:hypothetical protein
LPPLSSPGDLPPQTRSGREAFADCDMGPQGGGCAPAGHTLRRVPAGACPRLIRANGGQRPAIHSPQRHPLRTAGFRRPASNGSGRGLAFPSGAARSHCDRLSEPAGKTFGVKIASRPPRRRPAVRPRSALFGGRAPLEAAPLPRPAAGRTPQPRALFRRWARPAAPILGQAEGAPFLLHATVLFAAPVWRRPCGLCLEGCLFWPRSRTFLLTSYTRTP